MSSSATISNRSDGKNYRVSVVPVNKQISIPRSVNVGGQEITMGETRFDNITFEAAVFEDGQLYKPLFVIELDDGYSAKMNQEEFAKLICHSIENEKIDDLISGNSAVFERYGFIAIAHDLWQFAFLSNMRFVYIFKKPSK